MLLTSGRWRDSNPSCAPPCPCRRKRPDPGGARRRPRQDCSSTCAWRLPAAIPCRRAWRRGGRECECRRMFEFQCQPAWGYGSSRGRESSMRVVPLSNSRFRVFLSERCMLECGVEGCCENRTSSCLLVGYVPPPPPPPLPHLISY